MGSDDPGALPISARIVIKDSFTASPSAGQTVSSLVVLYDFIRGPSATIHEHEHDFTLRLLDPARLSGL
jgi:hypothetical protein